MVGAGEIIAQCFRAVLAQEDGAGAAHPVQIIEGRVHAQFQMLGGDFVGNVDGQIQIFRHNNFAIVVDGCPGDLAAGQQRNLSLQLRLHRFGQLAAVGDKHRACQFIVLGLTEHVRRHDLRVAGTVRYHQNLAGAGNHVDGHPAEYLLFGFRHIGVAGAHDFIHPGQGLGAIGKARHRLRAAHLEDAIHARDLGRRQNHRVHLAVCAGRGDHHQLGAARDFGGDAVHQYGGGVGRGAAGHIQTHLLDGHDLLAQHHAGLVGHHKAVAALLFVEGTDVRRRLFQNRHKFRLHRREGLVDLRFGHFQIGKVGLVKAQGVFPQGLVAPGGHLSQNLGHRALHIGGDVVPGKNFAVGYLAVFINGNHVTSPVPSFWPASLPAGGF